MTRLVSGPLSRTRLCAFALALTGFLAFAFAPPRVQAAIVINEIHYAPGDDRRDSEFLEILNTGPGAVDLSGWCLTDAVEFTFDTGTSIGAGEYLVVVGNRADFRADFGDLPVEGPFDGRLSNQGDDVILRDARGFRVDEVSYQRGFPWPTAGGDDGFSIELIHPSLDNDLGGSWRLANGEAGPGGGGDELVASGQIWRYRKGTSEASSPRAAWRQRDFVDGGWSQGRAPIGYGENFVVTDLDDMQGGYSSVFLRREFNVDDAAAIGRLTLEARYDDGFIAWINGRFVASDNVDSNDLAFDDTASGTVTEGDFVDFNLPPPSGYIVDGVNVLCLQLFNASRNNSSDAYIDARLTVGAGGGIGPTPGTVNAMTSSSAPPQLRQVAHFPESPVSGEVVAITVKATDPDGVAAVELEYQIVEPGSYVRLSDSAFDRNWVSQPMLDDGEGLDLEAGDSVYTLVLPTSLQEHRRLIRYRIRATDSTGATVDAPYADDPQPNFAYFVYDGVPSWRGAVTPGSTPVVEFDAELMASLPVYHLIANATDVTRSQYDGNFDGVHMLGTLVYDGEVYDHIEFENRGEFSTYVSGKNKWRIHLLRGHGFQGRDDHGRKRREKWKKIQISACASPWVPTNRGMAGLDEAVGFRSYDLAGVPSSYTNWFSFRIIDEALEAHATDQYRGDLWGLYLTNEHTDGRFLDERRLPDGNVCKIEGGSCDLRHQGLGQTVGTSDYGAFRSGFGRSQPISWWRSNVDVDAYYSFRATNIAINNMDLREGWNHCMYHNGATGRWSPMPWDLDMLYMPVTHWSGTIDLKSLLTQHAQLALEYRNRCRELGDLLYSPDQFLQVVAELFSVVSPIGQSQSWATIDQAMWNEHPRTRGGHRGAFYRNPSTHGARGGSITRTLVAANHAGMAQWIVDFATEDYGATRLAAAARDTQIPEQPTVTILGSASFPIDDLRFRSSAFADPQGGGTFGALEWRLAEIAAPGAPAFDSEGPKAFEIDSVWESGPLDNFGSELTVPAEAVETGAWYRLRARMTDTSGRTSHWSEPVEFRASSPLVAIPAVDWLRVTELSYHPPEGKDLEFVELRNVGPVSIDLRGVRFTKGIDFDFIDGDVLDLAPGEYALLVKNRRVFEATYTDVDPAIIAGEYSDSLSNAGDRLRLVWGRAETILDFAYDDAWYPETDGPGRTLHIVDDQDNPALWVLPSTWAPSLRDGGSPGEGEGVAPVGGLQLPGDENQDGSLDISDAVALLRRLFIGVDTPIPCEGGLESPGNLALLDANDSSTIDIGDAVWVLSFLFRGGAAPASGVDCVLIPGCPDVCVE